MSKLFLLSEEEAIEEIKQVRFNLNCQLNGTSRFEEAFEMVIKALEQIEKIKSIINGPVCMQWYVPKYMDICEVLKEAEHD